MLKKLPFTKLKLFLPLFIFLFFTQFGLAQDKEDLTCEDFKNGIFEIEDVYGPPTRVSRKGKLQIEKKGAKNVKFEVKWVSECVYVLHAKDKEKFEKYGDLHVTILAISGNVAIIEATFTKLPQVPPYEAKMTKIE